MTALGAPYSGTRLFLYFIAWKVLLLVLVALSPGDGYDTSARILFDSYASESQSWAAKCIEHVVLRLTRWDGIYFATNAERGHSNEQDWAFSWAFARLIDGSSHLLTFVSVSSIVKRALSGATLSHIFHWLAVHALHGLTKVGLPKSMGPEGRLRIAFTAACLHIVSPAGVFLSGPYAESAFASASFCGIWAYICYGYYRRAQKPVKRKAGLIIASGILFLLATTARSNGVLWGLFFAYDALGILQQWRFHFTELLLIGFGGSCIILGFIGPQYVAYKQFCNNETAGAWCSRRLPSIYGWVQDQYWEVGFLRYWTFSNLPLFVIALPVLGLLIVTSYIALSKPEAVLQELQLASAGDARRSKEVDLVSAEYFSGCVRRLALPQLALAVLAATNFHVQIINRISSGYPLWYIFLAVAIYGCSAHKSSPLGGGLDHRESKHAASSYPGRSPWLKHLVQGPYAQIIVRGMIMYAIIQGGLYASFLPPA